MSNVLEDSLFVSQNKKFDEIQSIVRQFSAEYVGNSIIKDNIFAVIQNYARKKEIALELLRYPIHDDELWALTFLKQDTIFVCVNTALPLCKQFFAAAHELYHIYCYVENADQSYIKNGSMLDSATGDETGRTQEDLEANAFAGLLLMPDQLLHEQILLYGLDKDLVTVDSVLMLMDMFAMPYKAVVLRLFESGNISHQQAEKLLEVGSADVMERVSLTGKAKRWQLDGKGTESFGTLLEKVEYNRQHEYLTESRENEDVAYLAQLKKEYGLDRPAFEVAFLPEPSPAFAVSSARYFQCHSHNPENIAPYSDTSSSHMRLPRVQMLESFLAHPLLHSQKSPLYKHQDKAPAG